MLKEKRIIGLIKEIDSIIKSIVLTIIILIICLIILFIEIISIS